jgi:hypothetical protein
MVPIFAACALAYSKTFNPRRTEDTTYGIWTSVLVAIIYNNIATFIINPQYNIYVSDQGDAAAEADPDASFLTQPDAQAVGVYVDLVLIRPSITVIGNPMQTLLAFLRQITARFHLHRLLQPTVATTVSILVELKPPPTRNPSDIIDFLQSLRGISVEGEEQAIDQGLCLMCTKRFCHQQGAVLIVGVGDWWRCILYTRRNAITQGHFRETNFVPAPKRVRLDREGHADEFMDPAERPGPVNVDDGPQVDARQTAAEKHKLTNAQDRARRFLRREAVRQARWSTLQEMQDLEGGEGMQSLEDLKITAKYPYDRETLRLAWNLIYGEPDLFLPDETIKNPVIPKGVWGPFLRLGDVSSDQ